MNNDQRSEDDSIKRIIVTCTSTKNAPKLTELLVPGFQAELAKLVIVEGEISTAGDVQALDNSGATDDNSGAKFIMAKLTVRYSLRGAVKARNAGNHKLAEQLNHRKNYINKVAKSLAIQRATDMRDALANNLTICNNVTTADIDLIDGSITNFKNIETQPIDLIEEKKADGTDALIPLFKEADAIIENMLALIESYYEETDPALLKEFQLAMHVIITGVHHTGLNTTCKDANPPKDAITEFLEDAMIKIVELNRTAISDINGLADIVKFKPGTYHVEFSLTGFVTQIQIINFKRGRMIDVQINFVREVK